MKKREFLLKNNNATVIWLCENNYERKYRRRWRYLLKVEYWFKRQWQSQRRVALDKFYLDNSRSSIKTSRNTMNPGEPVSCSSITDVIVWTRNRHTTGKNGISSVRGFFQWLISSAVGMPPYFQENPVESGFQPVLERIEIHTTSTRGFPIRSTRVYISSIREINAI